MISLTDIELRRGTKVLLNEAQLVIHPGQHIGIIGANGCGKSSLFKLLMGQITQDAGNLFIPNNWRICLLYTSPSPRDVEESRMPSSA